MSCSYYCILLNQGIERSLQKHTFISVRARVLSTERNIFGCLLFRWGFFVGFVVVVVLGFFGMFVWGVFC